MVAIKLQECSDRLADLLYPQAVHVYLQTVGFRQVVDSICSCVSWQDISMSRVLATSSVMHLYNCRAKLAAPYTFSPGEETLQTAMFAPEEIPFDEVRPS